MSEPGGEWRGEGRRFLARLALVGALAWGLARYIATRPAPAATAPKPAAEAPEAAVQLSTASEAGAAVEPSSAALESPATGEAIPAPRP